MPSWHNTRPQVEIDLSYPWLKGRRWIGIQSQPAAHESSNLWGNNWSQELQGSGQTRRTGRHWDWDVKSNCNDKEICQKLKQCNACHGRCGELLGRADSHSEVDPRVAANAQINTRKCCTVFHPWCFTKFKFFMIIKGVHWDSASPRHGWPNDLFPITEMNSEKKNVERDPWKWIWRPIASHLGLHKI